MVAKPISPTYPKEMVQSTLHSSMNENCITWSSMPKLMNLRISSYVITKYPEKVLVNDLNLFFEEEGENFLIMNTGWSYVTFKSIGELDE